LTAGQSYTVGLEDQNGIIPAFMVWAVPVQITVGTEATATANITPRTINRITDKDTDGNIIKQLTITDSTGHFTGDGNRYIRILKVASDGTETQAYPKTLIQNGTDGTIITENFTEGTTIVQVTHDFTDEATYPKGTYKVELYLTDTSTKPVTAGNLVIAERPVKLIFFHDDHLGTPRLITDEDGQTVSTHDYLAYGEEITTADFQTNNMKFTGHERDEETNLDYMKARYYTAGFGRFLQVDPGHDYDPMDPMSYNLYGYVRGNPVRNTDPDGKVVTVVVGGLALAGMVYTAYRLCKMSDEGESKNYYDKTQQAADDAFKGKENGPNGPPNAVIQQSNKDVFEVAKEGAEIGLDTVKDGVEGPDFGPGAKPANAIKATKGIWGWVKKAANWVLNKVKTTPEKKKNLKINSGRDRGKPKFFDKDYEPIPKGDEDTLIPSPKGYPERPSKRLPEPHARDMGVNKLS
jgi:RHS repeat-associated protein